MIADTSVGPASYDHILEEEAVQDECNMTTWMQYEMTFREGLFTDLKNCKANIKMIPIWYKTVRLVSTNLKICSVASCTLTTNHHKNINLASMHPLDTSHQCTRYDPVAPHSVLDDNLPCTVWLLRSIQ